MCFLTSLKPCDQHIVNFTGGHTGFIFAMMMILSDNKHFLLYLVPFWLLSAETFYGGQGITNDTQ